jgi:hypothetical protein
MQATDARLVVFVLGLVKTKGSQEHIGHGQLRQSVPGPTRWAILMAETMRRAWSGRPALCGPLYCASTFVLAARRSRRVRGHGQTATQRLGARRAAD